MRIGIMAFILGNSCLLFLPVAWYPEQWLFYHWLSKSPALNYVDNRIILLGLFSIVLLGFGLMYKKNQACFMSIKHSIANIFFTSKHRIYFTPILAFLAGFIFTALYVNQFYPTLNLTDMEGKDIIVKGLVDSIPKNTASKQSFIFLINARQEMANSVQKTAKTKRLWDDSFQGKVRLSWYHNNPHQQYKPLKNGQQWQFTVRLKRPNGFLNGGFDYEKWLYQKRIVATGYVRTGQKDEVNKKSSIASWLAGIRQNLADKMDCVLVEYPYRGLIKALTLGIRDDIEAQQWQAFMHTGTNHLIAISGLHISLMASLIWFVVNYLWRLSTSLNLKYPATIIASIAALVTAIAYAALAGFSLPTQRALIMLVVVFLAIILRREFLPSYVFLLALLAVVLFDPLSPLSSGFWLSFLAVAVIYFSISSRLAHKTQFSHKLLQLGCLQVSIFIGLFLPLMILFQQVSLISPLANFIAVPLMSLIIVPLTFVATFFILIFEPIGLFFFEVLKWPIDGLFWFLDALSQWPWSFIYLPEPSWSIITLLIIGCLLLLMPKGWPGRWLGLILLLPIVTMEAEKLQQGELQMTMLDVGQGLAMLVRTQHHSLLYDTGNKFSEQFNMADRVILPYMRLHKLNALDKLIISHSDRDHSGAYQELVNQILVGDVLAGEPELLPKKPLNVNSTPKLDEKVINPKMLVQQCKQGMQWQWDGVSFTILSPQRPIPDNKVNKKNNNRSCVLLIQTVQKQTILLLGDIEKELEKQLLKLYPTLTADVIQVPHHGSNTSSSDDFLEQLHPKIALFSFGYRNRFHHPAQQVVRRYKQKQIKLYNTNNGAIDIRSNMTNNSFSVKQYRVQNQRLWHRQIKQL